jgi:hypothetical protein
MLLHEEEVMSMEVLWSEQKDDLSHAPRIVEELQYLYFVSPLTSA